MLFKGNLQYASIIGNLAFRKKIYCFRGIFLFYDGEAMALNFKSCGL